MVPGAIIFKNWPQHWCFRILEAQQVSVRCNWIYIWSPLGISIQAQWRHLQVAQDQEFNARCTWHSKGWSGEQFQRCTCGECDGDNPFCPRLPPPTLSDKSAAKSSLSIVVWALVDALLTEPRSISGNFFAALPCIQMLQHCKRQSYSVMIPYWFRFFSSASKFYKIQVTFCTRATSGEDLSCCCRQLFSYCFKRMGVAYR